MKSYTVHRKRRTIGQPNAEADATVFVREGFSWPALLVPLLWAVYHRLWLVLLGYVVVAVGGNVLIAAAGFPSEVNFVASAAIQVLFAAEACDLRRWTLARRGFEVAALIVAKNEIEAESRYFRAWCDAISVHRAAHAAGDRMEISFRARSDGPPQAQAVGAPQTPPVEDGSPA
jgi:hypothetical protein